MCGRRRDLGIAHAGPWVPGMKPGMTPVFFDAARRDLDIAHAGPWVPGMKPGMTPFILWMRRVPA